MAFFRFLYKQSEKSTGKSFLFIALSGLLFALSLLVYLNLTLSKFDENKIRNFGAETGCVITNYVLTCNESKYEYEEFVIDLNYDLENPEADYGEKIIFTANEAIVQGAPIQYKQFLESFQKGPDFSVEDLVDTMTSFLKGMIIFIFFVMIIVASFYYGLANTILAGVMMSLINKVKGMKFKYEQVYRLTVYTALPYIALNAIIRMFSGHALPVFITGYLPQFMGWVLRVVIDYSIIFAITFFTVKYGHDEPVVVDEVGTVDKVITVDVD